MKSWNAPASALAPLLGREPREVDAVDVIRPSVGS